MLNLSAGSLSPTVALVRQACGSRRRPASVTIMLDNHAISIGMRAALIWCAGIKNRGNITSLFVLFFVVLLSSFLWYNYNIYGNWGVRVYIFVFGINRFTIVLYTGQIIIRHTMEFGLLDLPINFINYFRYVT